MAKKKTTEKDEPEKDVFDEDEANEGPPTLKPGDEGAQDASEKPQDAPGTLRDQWTEELTKDETKPQEKPLGNTEPTDDRRRKVIESREKVQVQETQTEETLIDPESEEFRSAFRRFLEAEKAARQAKADEPVDPRVQALAGLSSNPEQVGVQFKVTRGMVGAFREGSIIQDIRKLGVGSADIPRLIEEGVILPVEVKQVPKS